MAYQQPQARRQTQRVVHPVLTSTRPQSPHLLHAPSPEEWILFSPQPHSVTSHTGTSQTPRTTNVSHISDFGSLGTAENSELTGFGHDAHRHHVRPQHDDDGDDDDGELDSLDDGLHAFDAPSGRHLDQSGTVLPSHDGLGTFKGLTAANHDVQDQIWQHERYNPQARQVPKALSPQEEQRQRIEQWRVDQSRAVMEEIEQEARRRRRRLARRSSIARSNTVSAKRSHRLDTTSDPGHSVLEDMQQSESIWHKITRRVIQDLIGLDAATLAIIFGEDFIPDQVQEVVDDRQPASSSMWERKLLSRIARELGMLVDQINVESTRAFSTYERSSPVSDAPTAPKLSAVQTSEPVFRPTLSPAMTHPDQHLWNIEEEHDGLGELSAQAEEDYWQKDPSIRMIFGYLVGRFSSSESPRQYSTHPAPVSADAAGPLPAAWANQTDDDAAPRADLIRKHHPLVSQSTQRRRETLLRRHLHHYQQSLVSPVNHPHIHRGTRSNSCASQSSNKRSRRSLSAGGTGLSRNYWDFPGGTTTVAGSEVSVASGPGANSWGDV